MPSLQVVDLGDQGYKKRKGIGGFMDEVQDAYKGHQERSEMDRILGEYKQNMGKYGAYSQAQLELSNNNQIAPTKRLQLLEGIDKSQKGLMDENKALNEQYTKAKAASDKAEDKTRAQESVYEMYKPHMSEEEARKLSEIDTEATARTKVAQFNKPPPKNKFDETLQGEAAKDLQRLESEIPKARDALANLDRIEELSKNELSGLKGYAKAALNTESAAEMENLAFTAIEPIIKLFNPVGPIPVQKMKIIQQQFQMKPGDLQTSINGKINALRRIGQQGLARAEQRSALIKKYKGLVPEQELKSFDASTEQLQDALVDQEAWEINTKGKKDTDLIEDLYSKDGKKLKPIPLKEAKKLYEEGRITYVPNE